VLRLAVAIGFYISEVVLLVVCLSVGLMVFTAVTTPADVGTQSLGSIDEVRRAVGASVLFAILSGFAVSVAVLLALFRTRPLCLMHAASVALLFVIHATFFLFYLMGRAVPSSSAGLIAVGVACVAAAAKMQHALWNTWLFPRV
jgi:hypothetical protein